MDSIWNCAFGVDIDFQNNSDNVYFKRCEALFEFLSKPNILSFIGSKQSNFIKNKIFLFLFFISKLN